jgi:hypothetical protein
MSTMFMNDVIRPGFFGAGSGSGTLFLAMRTGPGADLGGFFLPGWALGVMAQSNKVNRFITRRKVPKVTAGVRR